MSGEMEALTQTIKTFSNFIVAITGLAVALVAVIKPIRGWIVRKITENFTEKTKIDSIYDELSNFKTAIERRDRDYEGVKKALVASLRNDITAIYYKARDDGGIEVNNLENFSKLYQVYTELGGNCYVHDLYNKVLQMPCIEKKNSRPVRRKVK